MCVDNDQPKMYHELTMNGKKLRQIRLAKGFSQRALAEKAQMDHSYISKIEVGGYKSISATYALKLAKALGLSIEDFLKKVEL